MLIVSWWENFCWAITASMIPDLTFVSSFSLVCLHLKRYFHVYIFPFISALILLLDCGCLLNETSQNCEAKMLQILVFAVCLPLSMLLFPLVPREPRGSSHAHFTFYRHMDLFNQCVVPENIRTPPRKITGNSEGEGGFKGSNFRGVGGVHEKLFSKGWRTTYKTLKPMYDRSEAQKHTYVRCFETKVGTRGHWDEVNIISFNVSVFLWVS